MTTATKHPDVASALRRRRCRTAGGARPSPDPFRGGGASLTARTRPGRLHASYLHVHWAGAPQIARRFATAARTAAAGSAERADAAHPTGAAVSA